MAALAATALSTACQSTTGGSPTIAEGPSTPVADIKYDPCTAFAPEVLTSAGLDPANSRGPYTAGAGLSTETGCRWSAPGGISATFTASLGKSARTVEEYLANPTFDSTPTSIAGRDVINFSTGSARVCNLAVRITGGSAIVVVNPAANDLNREQACAAARRITETIAPILP